MSEQAAPAAAPPQPAAPAEQKQPASTEKPNSTTQAAPDEDPELDFGEDLKFKKSEVAKRLKQQKELERGSFKRFEEAAAMRKQVEEFVGTLRSDTVAALKRAGLNREQIVKLAEDVLSEEIAQAQMSPEQREAMQTKAELERLRKEKEESDKKAKEEAEAAEVAHYERQLAAAFRDVITKRGLDQDEDTISRMAFKADSYWSANMDVSLEEIAEEIAQEDEARWQKRIGGWDVATLAKRLGARVEDVRKHLLAQAQPAPARQERPAETQRQGSKRVEKRPLTRAELNEILDQRTK